MGKKDSIYSVQTPIINLWLLCNSLYLSDLISDCGANCLGCTDDGSSCTSCETGWFLKSRDDGATQFCECKLILMRHSHGNWKVTYSSSRSWNTPNPHHFRHVISMVSEGLPLPSTKSKYLLRWCGWSWKTIQNLILMHKLIGTHSVFHFVKW